MIDVGGSLSGNRRPADESVQAGYEDRQQGNSYEANGLRRDADVPVCAKNRRCRPGSPGSDYEYDVGICFWTSSGVQMVNLSKQHYSVNAIRST